MPASIKHLSDVKRLGKAVESILAKWHGDGRFYKVVDIQECEDQPEKQQCKCLFEDNTSHWVETKHMHIQFDIEKLDESMTLCCVCSGDKSKAPNELLVCDSCNQGYHVECHEIKVDRIKDNLDDEDAEWICATCKYLLNLPTDSIETKAPMKKRSSTTSRTPSRRNGTPKSTGKSNKSASKSVPKSASKSTSSSKIKLTKREPKTIAADTSNAESPKRPASPRTPPCPVVERKDSKPKPNKGTTIERMDPDIIEAVRDITSKVDGQQNLDTTAFVDMICPEEAKTNTEIKRSRRNVPIGSAVAY